MIHYIQNENYTVGVQERGAELGSFRNILANLEYIWQADPAIWSRHAPVLFPLVGRLKDDTYEYQGQSYTLPQHGFARDQVFRVVDKSATTLGFELVDSPKTLLNYPFRFKLRINYRLEENKLTVDYEVQNTGSEDLYFSIGGHPGFSCPLFPEKGEVFSDYFLQFEKPETLARYLIEDGLQTGETEPVPLMNNTDLPLQYELFEKDAIVLKNIASEKLSMRSNLHGHGLNFTFRGYPYLGIWTKGENAPFICLEPWHGIAGSIDGPTELTQKEGIKKLSAGDVFTCAYTIEVF
jgi:galactose mutarotase-like enzyme